MGNSSFKVNDKLFLVRVELASTGAHEAGRLMPQAVNHVVVIDCSGSMWDALPKMREQLKLKLPKLLREGDTLSIIWFSSKKEFGVLIEGEPVATLTDLQDVNERIDRWLKPVGLTGFKEPIDEAVIVATRVAKKNPGKASLFFMSDGCDNQWSRPEILKSVEAAAPFFGAATFVEYGFYADRPMLAAMAEKAGGAHIFAEHFNTYAPAFEAAMAKQVSGAKRVEIDVEGDVIGGFAWSPAGGDLKTFSVESGKTTVPEDAKVVWYLSPTLVGSECHWTPGAKLEPAYEEMSAVYSAVSLFSTRMKPSIVLPLLAKTGDVRLIEMFGGCFGKQRYSAFQEEASKAAFTHSERLLKGYNPLAVPPDDAFTVLDLLSILAGDEGNRIMLDSPDFRYNRIGRAREAKADERGLKLEFKATPMPEGCPISSLVLNEDQPNVSFMVRKEGTIELPADAPPKLGGSIKTHIFRNYSVIKDGLVNVEKLPVSLTLATSAALVKAGVLKAEPNSLPHEATLDLTGLPVINRNMVKDVSAKNFFTMHWALLKAQAKQKVFNGWVGKLATDKKGAAFAAVYGNDAATWLKDRGVTEGGFNPKTSTAPPSGDFYIAKELKVSLKGLSSLPSFKDAVAAIAKRDEARKAKKKMIEVNVGTHLMEQAMHEVNAFMAGDVYTKMPESGRQAVLDAWLTGQAKAAKVECRKLIHDIAQTTFCIIVGQIWFTEWASMDENKMTLKFDSYDIDCKVEMMEVQIKM